MQHSDSRVLLRHYLSHEITADTRATTQHLEPQRDVMSALCSLSSTISKRQPTKLTTEQSRSVNSGPRVQELVQRRDKLRTASEHSAIARQKYEVAAKNVENEKARLRNALLTKIREGFDDKQAVIDIER